MPQRLLHNATVKVAEALQSAIVEIANIRKGVVTAEFILMALAEQRDSVVLRVLDELRMDAGLFRRDLVDRVLTHAQAIPDLHLGPTTSLQVSQDVQNLFEVAERERQRLGDAYISTGSVFLACFDESVPGTKLMLVELGLSYAACMQALQSLRGNVRITEKDAENRQSLLEQYTTDVTALARHGELDPVVGRADEINRVIEILSRRKKNNPILVGEPGVGKTVIVEGLALQIVSGEVPEHLLNRRVLSLEMGSLIAGAKMQGEFEERLKTIRDEVISAAGDIILFIDEIHTVVGAGRTSGGLDASNMLKPALAKGLLQCIGATTSREYKQYIESDKALERRFQAVRIEQPTIAQTIDMLRGLKRRYEEHHQIEYADEALQAAVELSVRYMPERFLPDKAIDLVDEAGAVKRLKVVYTPPEIRALDAKRHTLHQKKNEAFREHKFEVMAKYQMELFQTESELVRAREKWAMSFKERDRRVDASDIAAIISRSTGIPVHKMVAAEVEKLQHLEAHLAGRVVGQAHAVTSVANAIRRNRSGLRRPNAPIASFLFLGPTGVGKTELAKALAEQVMDDDTKIIRVDMSEFMQRHEVSKLIGSPPGYVGYGEGGQLTEKVRRNPYSIVLFDEFEKAHPDVFNLLLQVLDEGWLTDAEGQRVSFRNCIIIGTSNIGSDILSAGRRPVGLGAHASGWGDEAVRDEVMKEVKSYLRPEFVNRLDEIIIFHRLNRPELRQILDLQISDLRQRLSDLNIALEFGDDAKDVLLGGIEDLNLGARPLRRKIESEVENQIAGLLIGDTRPEGIRVLARDGKITLDFVLRQTG